MSKYVGFRLGKVHENHVISEYYCGGCGWPVTDHDSFCSECGGAFRECDASDLEAENTKLRKLVREMWFWAYCGHMDGESQEWQMKHISGVLERMRELGVEGWMNDF